MKAVYKFGKPSISPGEAMNEIASIFLEKYNDYSAEDVSAFHSPAESAGYAAWKYLVDIGVMVVDERGQAKI